MYVWVWVWVWGRSGTLVEVLFIHYLTQNKDYYVIKIIMIIHHNKDVYVLKIRLYIPIAEPSEVEKVTVVPRSRVPLITTAQICTVRLTPSVTVISVSSNPIVTPVNRKASLQLT